MPRPPRIEFQGAWYHLATRGNERREAFRDDRDRRRFLSAAGEACGRFGPVVAGAPRGNLSRAMQWPQTSYAAWFNRRHRRCWHLVRQRRGTGWEPYPVHFEDRAI